MTQTDSTVSSTFLTVAEVAGTLGVSTRTVRRLIAAGALPASDVAVPGSRRRAWRVERRLLDEWTRWRR
jgi:excisionase family DNA binding protein